MYLSECYHCTLDEKDWSTVVEDEMIEYTEFLCSVANDAKRLRKIIASLKIQIKLIKEEELENAGDMEDLSSEEAAILRQEFDRYDLSLPFFPFRVIWGQ